MNEIIAKLYDQAIVIEDGGDYVCGELDFEKFAELIVRECLSQVEKQYKPMLEDKTMMKDKHWVGYVECGIDSYAAIKEHFGVE
jgi:hypothetical protein